MLEKLSQKDKQALKKGVVSVVVILLIAISANLMLMGISNMREHGGDQERISRPA